MIRFDVAKAASKLAEFLVNLGPEHLNAAVRCLQYFYHSRYLGIKYSATGGGEFTTKVSETSISKRKQVFEAITDAFFANSLDRRSAEGYTFKLFGGLIDWAFRKQLTVSTSTIEAELLSMLHAGKELIWWIHLFQKLRFNPDQDVIIYNDNLQTIRILTSEIDKTTTKLRHVDVAQCWLRQMVQTGWIMVDYLPTAKMVVDGLTKLLSLQKHQIFIQQLGLVNMKDLIGQEEEV